jgi:oligoribonuclease NrnB/cAMP/cGMP phosphodiesterase (DHH superfamily)
MKNQSIEKRIMLLLAEYLNGNKKALKNLEELVKSSWGVRKHVNNKDGQICEYSLLHELNYYFENNHHKIIDKERIHLNYVTLKTEIEDVRFNLFERKIIITDYSEEKRIFITLNNKEISDELYDFICEFYVNNRYKINLKKLTERYKIIYVDLSGI